LYRIAASLLGGVGLPVALERFAADLTEQLGLARCEVYVGDAGNGLPPIAAAGREGPVGAESIDLPLTTERGEFGSVRIVSGSLSGFDEHRRRMARAFANQAALAVEMATLADDWRRAQAEAETSRARAALFSSVTHDLRTPLSTIRAAATSLLERGVAFDEDQRQGLLETITEESDRLNRLLTNVLSLSRFRAGTLTPRKSPTAMEDVIGVSVTSMRRRWEGTNIRVWVNEDLPLVPMDPIQIDQVLTNLLENALKFGRNGDPVELRASNEEGGVCVSISDCGPGIPPSEREKVFEEFFCHDAGSGSAGAGLGLAIARAVVVAHGGSIWIDETPTGGAIVGFRLPQAAQ